MVWRLSKDDARWIQGIEVRVGAAYPEASAEAYLDRVEDALGLLAHHLPHWLDRARRTVRGIMVWEADLGAAAWFNPPSQRCWLHPRYVIGKGIDTGFVATSILHEFTHAWIHSKGIPYGRHRIRIERICHEVAFSGAKKMSVAPRTLRSASAYLADVEAIHSTEARLRHWLADAESLNVPRWFRRLFLARRIRTTKRRLAGMDAQP